MQCSIATLSPPPPLAVLAAGSGRWGLRVKDGEEAPNPMERNRSENFPDFGLPAAQLRESIAVPLLMLICSSITLLSAIISLTNLHIRTYASNFEAYRFQQRAT